jgi:tRNA(Ile)-lysidine synthase
VGWLRERGLSWRTDTTNTDLRWTRNRLRHALLPLLRAEYNPQVDDALLRLAQQCRELERWLQDAAAAALDGALLERTSEMVRLSGEQLASLPRPLLREALLALWRKQAWPEQKMTFEHWERLAGLVCGSESSRLQMPGDVDVARDGSVLRLQRRAP